MLVGDRPIAETLAEPLYPAARIEDLLLAGIKRVAGGTDFQMDVLAQRGASLDNVPTTAGRFNAVVFGMDIRLHLIIPRWCPAFWPLVSGGCSPKKAAQFSQKSNE